MDAQAEKHMDCVRLLEKAMVVHERFEVGLHQLATKYCLSFQDEEDGDSGVILPTFHKPPSHCKSLFSQASPSIASSDDSSSESDSEQEVFEIDESRTPPNEKCVRKTQSDGAYTSSKASRQSPPQYRTRSYSSTQIDVYPRRGSFQF